MTENTSDTIDEMVAGKKADRWAEATVPVLERVASSYNGYITYGALMAEILDGYETRQITTSWSTLVLKRVIKICESRGLPALTSLVVSEHTGMVGKGLDGVIKRLGQKAPESQLEREMAAAVCRLECYRMYCQNVPADAEPQLTREYDEYRADAVRKNTPERSAPPACKVCNYVLLPNGDCGHCY